jgi:hypothetical protein
MYQLGCTRLLQLLLLLNLCCVAALAASTKHARTDPLSQVPYWMNSVPSQVSLAPNSPDNWLGGTGNWSNGADWSAGQPGSGSDVFINTGNDNVTLDVNASINSLTLGGTSGSSTLTNTGIVTLTIAGALTINQSGTLTFSTVGVSAGGTVTNAGTVNLTHGGLAGGTIINSGVITLDVGSVNASGSLTNSGSITARDDVTGVGGATIVNSGTISVATVGSSGDLTNQSGGVVSARDINVGGNLINRGTIQGHSTRSSTLTVTGELINTGTVDSSYGSASFGSVNNPGGGLIRSGADIVLGNVTNDGNIQVVSLGAGEPPASFGVGGNLETSGLLNVAGSGGVGASVTVASSITNSLGGLIEVDTLSSMVGASMTNSGTIRTGVQGDNPGGNSLQANTLNNLAAGTLLLGGVGDTGQFGSVNNAGSISVANGATLNIIAAHAGANASPGFLNSGIVQLNSGGTLFSARTYTQTGGQTTVDGLLHVAGSGVVNFAGGSVYGNGGTIQANTISDAAFNMGDMPNTIGTMAIRGNYTQGANGSIAFDIASLTSFDQLNVTGHASLNGTLFVALLDGYIPQVGNMFDIMNFAGSSGTFSMTVGLPINSQEHFVLEYNATNLTLDVVAGPGQQAQSGHGSAYYEPYVSEITGGSDRLDNFSSPGATVPEPGSWLLLASGMLSIAGLRRNRSR